jgi:hypothetical protein
MKLLILRDIQVNGELWREGDMREVETELARVLIENDEAEQVENSDADNSSAAGNSGQAPAQASETGEADAVESTSRA